MNLFALSLIPAIGLLVPFVFIWSLNTNLLFPKGFFLSACLLVVAAILVFGINYLVTNCIKRVSSTSLGRLVIAAYISIIFILATFFIVDLHIPHQRTIWAAAGFLVALALIYWKKGNVVLVFMCVMLVFSCCRLFFNLEAPAGPTVLHHENIVFKKRPNIYLYWLESYHDFDLQKSVYGIDTQKFNDFLLKDGFIIQQKTYSSAEYTLFAFAQLFSGQYKVQKTPYFDVLASWRYMIGGNENNFVLRTLKNNGYNTCILTKNSHPDVPSGYYLFPGKYLDETDFDKDSLEFLLQPIIMVTYSKTLKEYMDSIEGASSYKGDLFARVKQAMAWGKASGEPVFIAFKGGAHHTGRDYDLSQRKEWISSGFYQNAVKESDAEAEKILSYIIQHDPDSIIVLLGDHGAWSYRPAPVDNDAELKKYGATQQDVIDDLFRVLLAYRMPDGVKYDLTKGMYMNNLTVFYHIFSYLAEDPGVLAKRPSPIISYKGLEMKEGKVQ